MTSPILKFIVCSFERYSREIMICFQVEFIDCEKVFHPLEMYQVQ